MKDINSLKESLNRALKEEIPALDENLRNKIVEVTLKVIEKSAIFQQAPTNSKELQSLIEPVIWKVARALEENLGKKIVAENMELAGDLASAIGERINNLERNLENKIDKAKEDIEKTIRDINWQNDRLY
jgi:gas vesicle protein